MAKIVLPDVPSGYSLQRVNDNFDRIAEALNDGVLWRDNPGAEPNEMISNLDMNGKRIYNLPTPVEDHEAAPKAYVDQYVGQESFNADRAEAAAEAAEQSYENTVEVYEDFRGQYYGASSVEPTVDPNGNAPTAGDLYFDTTVNTMRVFTGTEWQDASGVSLQMTDKSFVGNGTQTIFVLDVEPVVASNVIVWVNQIRLVPDVDYTISGVNVILGAAPGVGIEVDTLVVSTTSTLYAPADGTVVDASVAVPASPADGIQASKLSFQRTGSPKVRSIQDKLEDMPYVDDFYLATDPDYSAAFLRAFQNCGIARLRPKDYLVSVPMTFNNSPASIIGDGSGLSRIVTGTLSPGTTLFSFNETLGTFTKARWLVRDVSFVTSAVGIGTALSFSTPASFDDRWTTTLRMEGVSFLGTDAYGTGWSKCVVTDQLNNVVIQNCSFKGVGGLPSDISEGAVTVSDTAISFLGDFSPTEVSVVNSNFYFWKIGILGGATLEGVKVINSTFVMLLECVVWNSGTWNPSYPGTGGGNAAGRPQLVMIGCHANVFRSAVRTDGVVSIHLDHNLFYFIDSATAAGNIIQIQNTQWGSITNNELWSFNSTHLPNGILMGPASGGILGASYYKIKGNIFRGEPGSNRFATHVWLMGQSSFIDCRDNIHFGPVSLTFVLNEGTNNTVDV